MKRTYVLYRAREIERDAEIADDYVAEVYESSGKKETTINLSILDTIVKLGEEARDEGYRISGKDVVTTIPARRIEGNIIQQPLGLEGLLIFRKILAK